NLALAGGTFDTGGHSNHFGTLSLSVSSTIELGGGNSILHFNDSSSGNWGSSILTVNNWSGQSTGNGPDQILVDLGSGFGFSQAELNAIKFPGYALGAKSLATGNPVTIEIVPATAPLQLGDINFDGVVNRADVGALMAALSDLSFYQTHNDFINN